MFDGFERDDCVEWLALEAYGIRANKFDAIPPVLCFGILDRSRIDVDADYELSALAGSRKHFASVACATGAIENPAAVHELRREFVALYVQPINLSGRNVGTIEFRRDKTFERGFTPWQMRMA